MRVHHDIAGLTYSSVLAARAQKWAEHLAAGHRFIDDHHWQTCPGRFWASNVGRDLSVRGVEDAFEHSAKHRRNLLDSDFHSVGIGIARARHGEYAGYVYVVQDFCG